jgi:hypothetical protein
LRFPGVDVATLLSCCCHIVRVRSA